jgi:ribosome-binding factor A
MPRVFSRARRVAEQMQKEIAVLLQREFKDPRVGLVTVSGVDLSGDLMYARVYVTFLGIDDSHVAEAVKVLNSASGFFRTMIGSRMKLRAVPHISFHYDSTLVTGMKLSGLISESVRHDQELQKEHSEE